jgi:Flp pilus assembly protein TadD
LVPGLSAAPGRSSQQAQDHADEGMQLVQGGDLNGAEAELRRAVELDPDNSVYLLNLVK